MKKILQHLEISLAEIANLLLLPNTTVVSWFARGSTIPTKFKFYFTAISMYYHKHITESLADYSDKWHEGNKELIDKNITNAIKNLERKKESLNLKLIQLQKKEEVLLRHWHISKKLTEYLPEQLKGEEHVQAWLNLLGRKARFKLGDIVPQKLQVEQKLAGIEAELTYLERVFNS